MSDSDFLLRRLHADSALRNLEAFQVAPLGRYRTVGGEGLAAIARLYYGSDRAELATLIGVANGVQPGAVLEPGAVLVIPPAAGRNLLP